MQERPEYFDLDNTIRLDDLTDCGHYFTMYAKQKPRKQICSACGHRAIVNENKVRTVYHTPWKNKPLLISLSRRRYICKACGKTFWEDIDMLSWISPHLSVNCEEFIRTKICEGKTISEVEHICGASKNLINKVIDNTNVDRHVLPTHIALDEVMVFPKAIAIAKDRPHLAACVYDAENKILIDMLKSDTPKTVREHFESFNQGERNQVQTLSCDLKQGYITMAKKLFPNAVVYADKFHVAKLVCEAVDDTRKRITGKADDARREELNKASKLLLKREHELEPKGRPKVIAALCNIDAAELRRAWLALQLFYVWSDAEYATREDMHASLRAWIIKAKSTQVKEMIKAANTINRKIEYILNAWQFGRTNAIAEALNRRIKDIRRECRGFNSFKALRKRMLMVLGHPQTKKKPIYLFTRTKKEVVED